MNVAICMPSRGLVHSRTIESIQNLVIPNGIMLMPRWYMTHDLPIPNCHEAVAEKALAHGADLLFFVEEDNVLHPLSLVKMLEQLEAGYNWSFVDYPLMPDRRTWCYHRAYQTGEVLYTGLGCTLIHRCVLEAVERPWFDNRCMVQISNYRQPNEEVRVTSTPNPYGGHDLYLGFKARAAGFKLNVVEDISGGHAKIKRYGSPQTNHGAHEIEVWEHPPD